MSPLVPPQHLSYLRAGPFPIYNRPLVEPLHCRSFQIFHFICSTQSILSARSFRDLNSQRQSSVERRGSCRRREASIKARDGWTAGDRRRFDIKIPSTGQQWTLWLLHSLIWSQRAKRDPSMHDDTGLMTDARLWLLNLCPENYLENIKWGIFVFSQQNWTRCLVMSKLDLTDNDGAG